MGNNGYTKLIKFEGETQKSAKKTYSGLPDTYTGQDVSVTLKASVTIKEDGKNVEKDISSQLRQYLLDSESGYDSVVTISQSSGTQTQVIGYNGVYN